MEDTDGGLHPAVDGQSLDEDDDNRLYETFFLSLFSFLIYKKMTTCFRSHKPFFVFPCKYDIYCVV